MIVEGTGGADGTGTVGGSVTGSLTGAVSGTGGSVGPVMSVGRGALSAKAATPPNIAAPASPVVRIRAMAAGCRRRVRPAMLSRRIRRRRRAYLTLVILAPLLISVVVRSFGWLVILGPNGLVNSALRGLGLIDEPLRLLYTETAIALGLVHVFLSFMVLSVAAALGRIDPAVLRAAASLGAGPIRTFLRVVLPLSLPGVAAGSVIVFTLSASAFITPALLGGPRVKVMSYLAYQQTMLLSDWPYGAAIALVLLAMTSAGVLVYLRLLESGRLGVVFR